MKWRLRKESNQFSNIQKIIFSKLYFPLVILALIPISSYSNEITIKISGIGDQFILNENFTLCPSSIYLNNEPITIDETNCKKINIQEGSSVNIIKLVFSGTITSLKGIFLNMKNLIDVDLSNFNSFTVVNMNRMFCNCSSLNSINLFNFNTALVKDMEGMFEGCSSLNELDLSFFDTSKVISMDYMFNGCVNLISLNISNFVTSNVDRMQLTFKDLESLRNLDLNHFDTSKVISMNKMFFGMKSLTSLDLSNFNTSSVINMGEMFYEDENLEYLYLTNFDTSKVTIMGQMFTRCKRLISLDLSSFDTTSVTNMYCMFSECERLMNLNISNFKTPNLKNMGFMFYGCINLISLDISNLNTSQIADMGSIFSGCQNLLKLNLSNFQTNSVTNMRSMFSKCYSLTSLDLSSFVTSSVQSMQRMFYFCYRLKELDLSNFDTTSLINADYMFYACINIEYINFKKYNEFIDTLNIDSISAYTMNNIAICIDEYNNNVTKFKMEIGNNNCPIIDCSIDWKAHKKKIIYENNTCVENCSNFKYEYNNKCYSTCPEGADFCTPENIDTTNIIGTNIATSYLISFNTSISSEENEIRESNSYSERNIILSSSLLYEKGIYFNLYNITGETNQEIYLIIINQAIHYFLLLKEEDIIIECKEGFYFEMVTSEKERDSFNKENNNTNKLSQIDLGKCEDILKEHYHVNRNSSLIIIKFEKITNISLERTIQYEVYEPYNISRLDLSICNNMTINIYSSVTLSDGLLNLYDDLKNKGYDLFDINDAFYQDICTPYTSFNGTDVILSDRINYYYYNDELSCQSNCKFFNYSIESKSLICQCDMSNSVIDTKEVKKFTGKTLYESFYDVLKFSNYKVLLCYNLAFHINNITKNKGSIIAIIYFCLYLLFLILYCFKGISQLKIDISKKIFSHNFKMNKVITETKNKNIKKYENKRTEYRSKITLNKTQNKLNIKSSKSKSLKTENSIKKKVTVKNLVNSPPKKNSSKNELSLSEERSSEHLTKKVKFNAKNINKNNIIINSQFNSFNNISENNSVNKKNTISKINEENQNQKLDDFELNNLEYNEAIILDKRSFITTYLSVLKREHLVLFTFFIHKDHNIINIKLCRFIFLVCTDMALNVFFFADETMHKMFLNYGKFNFFQQIPQMVYSIIVSQLIEVFLCFLSMTDKHYYEIKKFDYNNRYEALNIIKCVYIKITFFFIFTFIMFIFYWYTIACFCEVYVNTQIAFITDSVSTFVLGLLYPFILYLIPVFLRIISLRAVRSNLSFLYKLSDIIPFF